jgi:hypothetical protein
VIRQKAKFGAGCADARHGKRQKAKVKSLVRTALFLALPFDRESISVRTVKLLLLPFAFCLLPFAFATAHEPITTKVRFNKEVVRILQRNCISCHREGGIAPMSLATYEEARPWAKAIKEEVLEKRMPPWLPVKGYGEFSNAPALTQHEIDLLVNWVEGGAPKGDEKDLPRSPLYEDHWQLGKPDLILKPASEIKIEAGKDERVAVIRPTDLKEDRWITAIDLLPGNGSIVHCATFYVEKDVAGNIKGEKGKKTASSTLLLGTWMPGQKSVQLPDGIARLLPAGSRIFADIHYVNSGEAARDQSQIGLYFAKSPPRKQAREREVSIAWPALLDVPDNHRMLGIKQIFTAEDDLEAIAIRPRAHPLIDSFQATAIRPDGTQEVMIWTRGYRFDWQPTYYFKRPIALPKGSRVEIIIHLGYPEDDQSNTSNSVVDADFRSQSLCSLLVAGSRVND